jgi:hypothetical protein
MDEKTIEQRKRVAAAMDDVMEIARLNEVGPLSFSDLLMSMASALYRSQGRSKDVFLKMAGETYDTNSRAAKLSTFQH